MTTTNLAEFGWRELSEAGAILVAYADKKDICPYFSHCDIQLMLNKNSGNVFLTDDSGNVLMLNGDYLEGFYSSPYEGYEGFFDDLVDFWDTTWHEEDNKWLYQLAEDLNELDQLPNELVTLINK